MPVDTKPVASLKVLPGSVPVEAKYKDAVAKALAAPPSPKGPIVPKGPTTPSAAKELAKTIKLVPSPDYQQQLMSVLDKPVPVEKSEATGFGSFLLTAALWGIITLLTPCVFPMVPITVSVFLKQSEREGTNPVAQAGVYALTIVAVLGVSAMLLLRIFRDLSVNPWMNVGLGLLFVVFALSLFGMYDITVPSRLVNFTSKREGGGYLGTVFMGLTFSLISFTCVAPFLGGFAGLSASGNYSQFQLACGGAGVRRQLRGPVLCAGTIPKPNEENAEERWLDEHDQGDDGLPRIRRGAQVLPHR